MNKPLNLSQQVTISKNTFRNFAGEDLELWKKLEGSQIENISMGTVYVESVKLNTQEEIVICFLGLEIPLRNFLDRFFGKDIKISTDLFYEIKYKKIIDKITEFYSVDAIATAQKLFDEKIEKNEITINIYESIKTSYLINKVDLIIDALSKQNWHKATVDYKIIEPYLQKQSLSSIHDEMGLTILPIIEDKLKFYNFDIVHKILKDLESMIDINEFQSLISQYKIKFEYEQRKKQFIITLEHTLNSFDFNKADELFLYTNFLNSLEYETIKEKHIKNYFKSKFKLHLNDEQSNVISSSSKTLLIQARAGSGKTRVLTSLAALRIHSYQQNPDNILIMAFNNNAAYEINKRIKNNYNINNFDNARTFHSFAYQLVQFHGKLLFDQKGELAKKEFSEYVTQTIREIWSPEIQSKLYMFFKKELRAIENSGGLLDDEEFLKFIREKPGITLNGEPVKSMGEKYIADYFFEHNIPYYYEKIKLWDGRLYRPDFTLDTDIGQVVIEFWGIDENDPVKQTPESWNMDWDTYHKQMIRKREFWKNEAIPLLEFSIVDTCNGRESFENKLKIKLSLFGLNKEKLSEKELVKKVFRIQKDRMTNLFSSFIQIAKKNMWTVEETIKRSQKYMADNEREKLFISLGCQVYAQYQEKLKKENAIDFDDLIVLAAEKIRSSDGNCQLTLGHKKDRKIKVKDLDWILIDEYQDFSNLFYYLLKSIKLQKSDLRIVCVGDDWQAINSFAGSDLKFFYDFEKNFNNSRISNLLINHRSEKKIVDFSNELMAGKGLQASTLPENNQGKIIIQTIDNTNINTTDIQVKENGNQRVSSDKKFIFSDTRNGKKTYDNGFLLAKYLKSCYKIIKDPQNWQFFSQKENDRPIIAILTHNNKLHQVTIKDFLSKLKNCFTINDLKFIGDFSKKIKISTVHSFKGLEAEIVIVLKVCNGSFPLLHPDNQLFNFFGKTDQHFFDEEQRLFYVAVTRASKKLYLLTEEGEKSCFIK